MEPAARAQVVGPWIAPARIHVETPIGQGETVQLPPLAVAINGDGAIEVRMGISSVDEEDSLAVDGGWVRFSPDAFALAPGAGRSVAVWLDIPRAAEPGAYRARLRAVVDPAERAPGVAVAIRAAVASDLRFTVEEREIGALEPVMLWWRRYGPVLSLMLGAFALAFAGLHLRRRSRERSTALARVDVAAGPGGGTVTGAGLGRGREVAAMRGSDITVHGVCDPRFEGVRRAFLENFTERGDIGASVCVVLDGDTVVDLWAGWADAERSRPWKRDTIVNVYSATKGMTALCAHILADRGLLDFDAPVARSWPEFAQAGKEAMPVRYLLTHQAGLPVIDEPLPRGATFDWALMIGALERQAPVWEPGSAFGYHTVTFGWLAGEVIRRISGRSVGCFLREEVCEPLGVDFFIGTPASEDHRIADTVNPPPEDAHRQRPSDPESLAYRSNLPGTSKPGVGVNGREYRAAEIPAGNGHGNARSLARVYGALARGGEIDEVRLLSPEAVRTAAELQVAGLDAVLGVEAARSLGFQLPVPAAGDPRGSSAFGHPGRGGSLGFADPDVRLGFGYTMNRLWPGGPERPDLRARLLSAAVYEALR